MKETITPRERALGAIGRRGVDRVPVDFGGLAWSVVDSPPHGYRGLCEAIGLRSVEVSHKVGSHVVSAIDERILECFGVDFRHVAMGEPTKLIEPGLVEDSYGVRWRFTSHHYYPVDPPLAGAKTVRDLEAYAGWPDPEKPGYVEGRGERARRLREETGYAVAADTGPARSIFHRYAQLRGFNQWFADMRSNPDLYRALADRIYDVNTELLTALLGEVGDYVDIVCITDDMGSQDSPFLSVRDFREFVKPWVKRRVDSLRRMASGAKVLYHCCGSIYPLIPELIDCGIDILNPIQHQARGMSPDRLKKAFGDRLCFHGGIDNQKVLPLGSVEDVRQHVKAVLDIMAPGGGYILAASHHLQGDIPPQNIIAMYRSALEYRPPNGTRGRL